MHVLLVSICSSMVVLGVELSCNQDVIQCECVINGGNLQWSAIMPGDPHFPHWSSVKLLLVISSAYCNLLQHIIVIAA